MQWLARNRSKLSVVRVLSCISSSISFQLHQVQDPCILHWAIEHTDACVYKSKTLKTVSLLLSSINYFFIRCFFIWDATFFAASLCCTAKNYFASEKLRYFFKTLISSLSSYLRITAILEKPESYWLLLLKLKSCFVWLLTNYAKARQLYSNQNKIWGYGHMLSTNNTKLLHSTYKSSKTTTCTYVYHINIVSEDFL